MASADEVVASLTEDYKDDLAKILKVRIGVRVRAGARVRARARARVRIRVKPWAWAVPTCGPFFARGWRAWRAVT